MESAVEGFTRQPETIWIDFHDVLPGRYGIRNHSDREEGWNHEVSMELPQHSLGVPVVEVEGAEYIPATQLVYDLHQRFLPVHFNVIQGLAALIEVLNFPFKGVVLKESKVKKNILIPLTKRKETP